MELREHETWVFKVKPQGGDYAGFLAGWFSSIAQYDMGTSPIPRPPSRHKKRWAKCAAKFYNAGCRIMPRGTLTECSLYVTIRRAWPLSHPSLSDLRTRSDLHRMAGKFTRSRRGFDSQSPC